MRFELNPLTQAVVWEKESILKGGTGFAMDIIRENNSYTLF